MTPLQQTIFGGQNGNCLQACIASLLDKPLDEVVHFIDCDDWYKALELYMMREGYYTMLDNCVECYPEYTYYLAWGYSPRGIMHSVVYKDGELAHDPHPDNTGLEPTQIVYFVWTFSDAV